MSGQSDSIEGIKHETKSKDIIHTTLRLGKKAIAVILVYLSVNDKESNTRIKGENGKITDQTDDERCVVLLGDQNEHVGYLSKQKFNEYEKIISDVIERHKILMLNDDQKCEGTIT